MAISIVQSKLIAPGVSGSFTNPTTAGNTVFVVVGLDGGSQSGTTLPVISAVTLGGVADNFASQVNVTDTGGTHSDATAAIWMDPNCAGGQTAIAVTATHVSDSYLYILEVSGLGSAPTLDKSATHVDTTAPTSWSSGATATTTTAAELWLGIGVGGPFVSSDVTTGPSSPWVNQTARDGTALTCIAGEQITTSTGAATYSGGFGTNTYYVALVATFQFGGSAGGTAPPAFGRVPPVEPGWFPGAPSWQPYGIPFAWPFEDDPGSDMTGQAPGFPVAAALSDGGGVLTVGRKIGWAGAAPLSGSGTLAANAGGGGAVLTVVQSVELQGSASGTFPNPTTAGNTIILAFAANGLGAPPSISAVRLGGTADNFASQYAYTDAIYSYAICAIWMDADCAGGASTIAVSGTNLNRPYVYAVEVAGMGTVPTLDQVSVGPIGSGLTTWTSNTTPATTSADEFLIGVTGHGRFSTGDTLTGPPGPWTNGAGYVWPDGSALAGYQITAATGGYAYSGSSVDFDYYVAIIATFAPAPGAAGVAALSGSGTLGAADLVKFAGAAALSGSGTLSPASTLIGGFAALTGSGTLTAQGTYTLAGAAALTGNGQLIAIPTVSGQIAPGPTLITPFAPLYLPLGLRKIYWEPAIASTAAPTRRELNAGLDLSAEIASMTGWTTTVAVAEYNDIITRFGSQIPGAATLAESSIDFYLSANGNDVRRYLGLGSIGFVVCLWEGDFAGQHMDVFPVVITSWLEQTDIENGQIVSAGFSLYGAPGIQVTIP